MIAYDSDVYDLRANNGWVITKNSRDIDCYNYFQLLDCNGNVFTGNVSDKNDIEQLHSDIKSIKSSVRFKIHYAIPDGEENGHQRFKVVDKNAAGKHGKALIHTESVRTYPPEWPVQIKWKNKGFVLSNGSGIGFIRPYVAYLRFPDVIDFKKINIR